MSKYTQGEWVLLRGGIEVQSETNEHEIFAYVGEHPVAIASVLPHLESEHDMPISKYSMSKEEGMANAVILTAAPKMYAAIVAFLEQQDKRDNQSAWEAAVERLRSACAAVAGA